MDVRRSKPLGLSVEENPNGGIFRHSKGYYLESKVPTLGEFGMVGEEQTHGFLTCQCVH